MRIAASIALIDEYNFMEQKVGRQLPLMSCFFKGKFADKDVL